jgi:hypothetical protein
MNVVASRGINGGFTSHGAPSGECDVCKNWSEKLLLDHKIAGMDGGTHTKDNLQWLCPPCNAEKTREEQRRNALKMIADGKWTKTAEQNQRIANKLRGRVRTPEQRERQRQGILQSEKYLSGNWGKPNERGR